MSICVVDFECCHVTRICNAFISSPRLVNCLFTCLCFFESMYVHACACGRERVLRAWLKRYSEHVPFGGKLESRKNIQPQLPKLLLTQETTLQVPLRNALLSRFQSCWLLSARCQVTWGQSLFIRNLNLVNMNSLKNISIAKNP